MEVPILGVLFDDRVGFVAVFERATDERLGKKAHGGFVGGGRGQRDGLAPRGHALFLCDGGGALGVPEMIERRLEILGRVHIMLEQKLHGAFARFPSLSHTNLTMPEDSRLGKRKMKIVRERCRTRCYLGVVWLNGGQMETGEINERSPAYRTEAEATIPPDWLADFEAAAKRSLETRFRYSFIRTYKPVLDDAPFRAFDTTADYRRWCEENLPDWLGYGRV